MTYNKTKNSSIILLNILIISAIIIISFFCLFSTNVHADTIVTDLYIESSNYYVPIAVRESNADAYPRFPNGILNLKYIIDYANNRVGIVFGSLSIYNSLYEVYGYGYDYVKMGNNYFHKSLNQEILWIDLSNFRVSSTLEHSNIYNYNATFIQPQTAFSFSFNIYRSSINNLQNLSYLEIENTVKEYPSAYTTIGGTRFTFYDSLGNWITIMPLFAYYSPGSTFPNSKNTYETNLNNLKSIANNIGLSNRRYYNDILTNEQINQESYNIGLEKGKLEGYEIGKNDGKKLGYTEGFEKGKIEGIASKGESVWVNSMGFIKNLFIDIFDIFSIEILPNISIGTFIVIPLIFGVLFFIVKITKGD